jgi:urease accessory protein
VTGEPASADESLAGLRLLQLADSALPIGSLAHSFGLESLVSGNLLDTGRLPDFLHGYIEEAGLLEAVFCRAAFQLSKEPPTELDDRRWLELNDLLSARKPARESRMGSASLGRNFLAAVCALEDLSILRLALQASRQSSTLIHHSVAFGIASGALGIGEERGVLAFLHQSAASLVSACQRLLPLGQSRATSILWNLKRVILTTAERSSSHSFDDACSFTPLLDWGAMEHPALSTRLFIS